MDLGFRLNMDEIHLILERYSRGQDTHLKYSEFSEAFMPMDQHFARLLGNKRLSYVHQVNRNPFDQVTLNKYMDVWELMIQNEKEVENIRQSLYKRPKFNIDDAFSSCDLLNDGFVTGSEVS